MNARRQASRLYNLKLEQPVRAGSRRKRATAAVVVAGLVFSILAGIVLLPDNAVAAAPQPFNPCLPCADASDPLQVTTLEGLSALERERGWAAIAARYDGLAVWYAGERRLNAAASGGLALGDAADPLQVTALETMSALERERGWAANAARYDGLSAWYAGERRLSAAASGGLALGDAADPLQVSTLEGLSALERERGWAASAARYDGLAASYAAARGGLALGDAADPLQVTTLQALNALERERSWAASAARYKGLAVQDRSILDAAWSAYGARLQGLADCYERIILVCSVR